MPGRVGGPISSTDSTQRRRLRGRKLRSRRAPGARALTSAVANLGVRVGLPLHNTRNTGYANAVAGLEAGAATLDCSVGGLGGCPFAPGATGNVATEDLVYMLERDGVATGVDLDELIATARWVEAVLGKRLSGQLHRVGPAPARALPAASMGGKQL